jgi:NAD(P)-dependent dehydrogenase (short-subunit alcohol dehydrogenase family)
MDTKRVVVITGAGGGLGVPLVERFIRNGDRVIGTDTSEDALKQLATQLEFHSGLLTLVADVSSEADAQKLADFAREHGGTVEVLINCAGFFPILPFEEISFQDWQRVIDVNLSGTFLMTSALLPLMKDRGWGRIVNFGSASVFDGTRNQTHYVAAKAGIVGFTRSLAREVGGYGITVNVITPGLTLTQAVKDHFPPAVLAAQRAARSLQRDETPEDLIGPVFFLASPDAGFITGQTLNVDGGKFMN